MISDGENAVNDSSELALMEAGISLGNRFLASDTTSETPHADVETITSEAREMILNFEIESSFIN